MASMRELADHIIAVANRNKKNISNLHLQKIMFFVFGRMVKEYGIDSEMVINTHDESFERWGYGPVVRSIYFNYNEFGGQSIEDIGVDSIDEYTEFDDRILYLLGIDPFKLVEVTHKLPSWANYKTDIENRSYVPPYQLEDFAREFAGE